MIVDQDSNFNFRRSPSLSGCTVWIKDHLLISKEEIKKKHKLTDQATNTMINNLMLHRKKKKKRSHVQHTHTRTHTNIFKYSSVIFNYHSTRVVRTKWCHGHVPAKINLSFNSESESIPVMQLQNVSILRLQTDWCQETSLHLKSFTTFTFLLVLFFKINGYTHLYHLIHKEMHNKSTFFSFAFMFPTAGHACTTLE